MINIAFMMLAASTFLLNPPTGIFWGYAELNPTADAQAQGERCGVSQVRVFSATASQIVTDSLSEEQRDAYDDLVGTLEDEWADSSQRERATLHLELLNIGSSKNSRKVDQTWVELDSVMVHYLFVMDMPSGGMFVKLEDQTTGQYVSVLWEKQGEFDRTALFERLFALGLQGEELKAVYLEATREDGGTTPGVNQEGVEIFKQFMEDAKQTVVTVEVNGFVRVLDDEEARRGRAQGAIAELWQHLPEGEGRRRIEMAVPVIRMAVEYEAAREEKMTAKGIADLSKDFDEAPEDTCLSGGGEIAGFREGSGRGNFEAPPADLINDVFGDGGMPLPDSDWSFKRLKKELL